MTLAAEALAAAGPRTRPLAFAKVLGTNRLTVAA